MLRQPHGSVALWTLWTAPTDVHRTDLASRGMTGPPGEGSLGAEGTPPGSRQSSEPQRRGRSDAPSRAGSSTQPDGPHVRARRLSPGAAHLDRRRRRLVLRRGWGVEAAGCGRNRTAGRYWSWQRKARAPTVRTGPGLTFGAHRASTPLILAVLPHPSHRETAQLGIRRAARGVLRWWCARTSPGRSGGVARPSRSGRRPPGPRGRGPGR